MSLKGLAERLRAARAAANLTQCTVANTLGYKAPTVANWEHDRAEPCATDLLRLATLYRVSVDWLLTGARMVHRFEPRPKSVPGGDGYVACPHGVPIRDRCMSCERAA